MPPRVRTGVQRYGLPAAPPQGSPQPSALGGTAGAAQQSWGSLPMPGAAQSIWCAGLTDRWLPLTQS
jgi:hypothetical protein